MDGVSLIVALVLLFLGRKLYWLFVGAVGFLLGMHYASQWLTGEQEWVILLVAVVAGLVGALLAVALQRLALAVAGFLGGGYFAVGLLAPLGINPASFEAIAFLVGGVIAAILVLVFLDPALIVISALVGASAIAQGSAVDPAWRWIVFGLLFVTGVAVQWGLLYRRGTAQLTDKI